MHYHKPTPEESAAAREKLAAWQNAELGKAIIACGLGHKAYAKWTIHDRLGYEPDRVVYCTMREGKQGWHPNDVEVVATTHDEVLPCLYKTLRRSTVTGENVIMWDFSGMHRYELWFSYLEAYHPLPAEELRKRKQTREANKLAKEKAAIPLFADQFDEVQP